MPPVFTHRRWPVSFRCTEFPRDNCTYGILMTVTIYMTLRCVTAISVNPRRHSVNAETLWIYEDKQIIGILPGIGNTTELNGDSPLLIRRH